MLSLGAGACVPALGQSQQQTPLDDFIVAEMSKAGIVGLAAGFAKDGEVRFARGYGFANLANRRPVHVDTMFHIASVTKLVTATAAMRLVEEKKLVLDQPVAAYLDFPLANPAYADVSITFRHLLMHLSSISDAKYYEIDLRTAGADSTLALDDFLKSYLVPGGRYYTPSTCFSDRAPGAAWDYCNVGYGLLGYLVSRIGGESLIRQTTRHIFTPLNMRHTSWTIRDTPKRLRTTPYDVVDGAPLPLEPVGFPDAGAGMLRTSIEDFMRFIAACANGGSAHHTRILQADTLSQMFEMKAPPLLPEWLTGQGLGWMESKLDGEPMPEHFGGDPGVFTAVYAAPATRSGVAVFTNTSATAASKAAVKAIASRLLLRDREPFA